MGREGGVWGWIAPVRSNVFVTVRNGFSRITSHLGVPVGDVPPIVLCQARDNVPEAQQALVDRARLLEPGALHAALEGALGPCEVHQVQARHLHAPSNRPSIPPALRVPVIHLATHLRIPSAFLGPILNSWPLILVCVLIVLWAVIPLPLRLPSHAAFQQQPKDEVRS